MVQTAQSTQFIIREHILSVFREILSDPDYGKELDKKFLKKLEKSIVALRQGKVIPFDEVISKYI